MATLEVSEGAAVGETDASTIDGLKAALVRALEQRRRTAAGSDGGVLETVRRDEYGDVVVEEGRHGRRAGDELLDSGRYLVVFRRQSDGSWRFATDMWNSDSAPAGR